MTSQRHFHVKNKKKCYIIHSKIFFFACVNNLPIVNSRLHQTTGFKELYLRISVFCAGPIFIITAINFRIINYQTIEIVSIYKSDSRGPQKVRSSRPIMLESETLRSFPEVFGLIEVWCRHLEALACLFVNYQQKQWCSLRANIH